MGRRLDLHPQKKLRNPGRHLRSLASWASDPHSWLPESQALEAWGGRYWHYKVPIHDKLVSSRDTTPAIRAAVAQCLLDAAGNVSKAVVLSRKCRVACLINPDNLFSSEVTIFFDDEYFDGFCPPIEYGTTRREPFTVSTAPASIDLVSAWGLCVPKELVDFGGYQVWEHEDGEPNATRVSHSWVFAEPAFQ